jgi:ubiquinone/menaquinone biosynthesis C-methylase UbiE
VIADDSRKPIQIVELGIGGFPNASYYREWKNVQVIGIEPDLKKHSMAISNANLFGLSLCMHVGFGEDLPLCSNSIDAVVSTHTLCSVQDVKKTLVEVRRILKRKGVFAFMEHVLSETNKSLATKQQNATPTELCCWGCRFDRRILKDLEASNFSSVLGVLEHDSCYVDIATTSELMSPSIIGLARR